MNQRYANSLVDRMSSWGYYLSSRPHPESPGYLELVVAIRSTPTNMHFDPEEMELPLSQERGSVRSAKLTLRTDVRDATTVCPGRIILRDRLDEVEEFFLFGGTIEIASATSREIVYLVRSAAPILQLTEDGVAGQLACETEALIGKLRAKRGAEVDDFACRLAGRDPLNVYAAVLQSLLEPYRRTQALRESFPDLYATLREEKSWLEETGQWPTSPASLEELLESRS